MTETTVETTHARNRDDEPSTYLDVEAALSVAAIDRATGHGVFGANVFSNGSVTWPTADEYMLSRSVEYLRGQANRAVEAESAARQTLERFQAQVREVAIRVAADQDWCDDGLNEVLAELGLDPVVRRHRFTLTVEVTAEHTGSVTHPDDNYVLRSIRSVDVDLDSDWTDVDVTIDRVTDTEPDE